MQYLRAARIYSKSSGNIQNSMYQGGMREQFVECLMQGGSETGILLGTPEVIHLQS